MDMDMENMIFFECTNYHNFSPCLWMSMNLKWNIFHPSSETCDLDAKSIASNVGTQKLVFYKNEEFI